MTSGGAVPGAGAPAPWQWASIVPVWALAVAGAAVVLALRPEDGPLTWFPIVLALATLAAFAIQLGIRRREGFVQRLALSVTGAVVLLGAATALAAVVA